MKVFLSLLAILSTTTFAAQGDRPVPPRFSVNNMDRSADAKQDFAKFAFGKWLENNKIPADKPAVAESGISNVETITTLRKAGFKGFLIGETFMKEPDPGKAFADFVKNLSLSPLGK